MLRFSQVADTIAATTKKLEKTRLVADYLKTVDKEQAAISAVFLSGRPFPLWEETTLQVGGRLLWRVVAELANKEESALTDAYRKLGDLGAVAQAVLPTNAGKNLTLVEVESVFRQIASVRGPTAKSALVRALLMRATPLEAKYIVKIMTGDLRIGLKESLVEEAIAKAYAATLPEVQRANMLLGDIGQTLLLATESKLPEARMRLFHPLGFMLASPIDSPEEGFSYFPEAAVEDKYDGIRAQAHIASGEVKLFSRTRDEITESFPELAEALSAISAEAVLDGEVVAWEYPPNPAQTQKVIDEPASATSEQKAANFGQARPFSVLQQRLGRKKVSPQMLREVPVAYLAFDVLYTDGQLQIDLPLRQRAGILDALLAAPRDRVPQKKVVGKENRQLALSLDDEIMDAQPKDVQIKDIPIEASTTAAIIRAPVFRADSSDELDQLFTAAQARGNEGLMIKDLASTYTPGKRGKSWLKMKRELATLDVVVTAVEYGHGKRINVLSDYTFAVWNEENKRLVNIGKAYSGLTDAEIAQMTQWFLDHTLEDQGFLRIVEPSIVLEVAFNNMMQSDRHASGYALRFPRIVRLRPDKSAAEADTLARAREIYEKQHAPH
jgi:DNA ligase-1